MDKEGNPIDSKNPTFFGDQALKAYHSGPIKKGRKKNAEQVGWFSLSS